MVKDVVVATVGLVMVRITIRDNSINGDSNSDCNYNGIMIIIKEITCSLLRR